MIRERIKQRKEQKNQRGVDTILTKPLEEKSQKPPTICKNTRVIGFRKIEKPEFEKSENFLEQMSINLAKFLYKPFTKPLSFVGNDLEKRFGDQLSLTYENFMTQIEETAKISFDNDLTYVVIYAHGNGKSKKPYVKIGKEKLTFEELLDKLDKIKGTKVLMIHSCGSGKLKDVLENRENKDDYWAITSSEGEKLSFDPICRKPWRLFDVLKDSLSDGFDEFKKQNVAKICQKATYIKGSREIFLN